LRRFVLETRRGETCHWLAILFTPLFLLWNPWWGFAVNLAYALLANVPCIVAQRYNRARLLALLSR
jgi:glycosyl-4,4'-diaponeurosporenoate acyltransferase